MMRWRSLTVVLAGMLSACARGPVGKTSPAGRGLLIDTLAIRTYTRFLADDRLLGRATGSPGADTAAAYIAAACNAIGLAPITAGYALPVPLEVVNATASTLTARVGDAERSFRSPEGFVLQGGTPSAFTDFSTRHTVVVGREGDILTGHIPAIRGVVAVSLGLIDAPAFDTLIARGAVAVIQATSDEAAFREWADHESAELMYVADSGTRSSYFPNLPAIVAGPALSAQVLAGADVTLRLRQERQSVPARNVGCLLRGSQPGPADTAIALTAHYDHLGVGAPDAQGDSIYNGFSDNAAGVGMLLAIAKAMDHATEKPAHSVLFLFFTGEERGLLGSDYYVAHPAWPLARTIAVINLDAGAPPALVWSWRIAGGDATSLGRLAVDVALSRGWSAVTSGPRANSDYFPFIRVGVPAVFLVPGPAPYQGLSADSSQALRKRWDHYHQPSDEWRSDFPFSGLGRYAEFALRLAQAIDRVGR